MYYLRYVYMRIAEAHVACNFDCFAAENEVLFKVTASHVHCKCGSISKAVPDEVIDATEYKSPIESDT